MRPTTSRGTGDGFRRRRTGCDALIDHDPFGGTCALRQRMEHHSTEGTPRIAWPDLIAFERTFTDPVPRRQEEQDAREGIDAFDELYQPSYPMTALGGNRTLPPSHHAYHLVRKSSRSCENAEARGQRAT
jgi:hypothetical protein